jgi:hypothetical protein
MHAGRYVHRTRRPLTPVQEGIPATHPGRDCAQQQPHMSAAALETRNRERHTESEVLPASPIRAGPSPRVASMSRDRLTSSFHSFPSTTMPSPPLFTLVAPHQTHPPSQTPSRHFTHHCHRCSRARPPRARSPRLARAPHHARSPILAFPYSTLPARVKYPPLPSVLRHARDLSTVTLSVHHLELGSPTSLPARAPYRSGRIKFGYGTLLTVDSLTCPSRPFSSHHPSSFQLASLYSPIPLDSVVRAPAVACISTSLRPANVDLAAWVLLPAGETCQSISLCLVVVVLVKCFILHQ